MPPRQHSTATPQSSHQSLVINTFPRYNKLPSCCKLTDFYSFHPVWVWLIMHSDQVHGFSVPIMMIINIIAATNTSFVFSTSTAAAAAVADNYQRPLFATCSTLLAAGYKMCAGLAGRGRRRTKSGGSPPPDEISICWSSWRRWGNLPEEISRIARNIYQITIPGLESVDYRWFSSIPHYEVEDLYNQSSSIWTNQVSSNYLHFCEGSSLWLLFFRVGGGGSPINSSIILLGLIWKSCARGVELHNQVLLDFALLRHSCYQESVIWHQWSPSVRPRPDTSSYRHINYNWSGLDWRPWT